MRVRNLQELLIWLIDQNQIIRTIVSGYNGPGTNQTHSSLRSSSGPTSAFIFMNGLI